MNSNHIKTSVMGFPRIGEKRELKKALENYWNRKISVSELNICANQLKEKNYHYQIEADIDLISVNDFSFYDIMLDMAVLFDAVPERFRGITDEYERYFAMARGTNDICAMEMTKWFNTNYHYIVPELSENDLYTLNPDKIINEYSQAKNAGVRNPKINIIGPLTFIKLSKRADKEKDTFHLLSKFIALYKELILQISALDEVVYLQIEEPVLCSDFNPETSVLVNEIYSDFSTLTENVRIIVATYFDHAREYLPSLLKTDIWGIGLDFIYGVENMINLPSFNGKKIIAGVVDGRNIWINDYQRSILLLNDIAKSVKRSDIIIGTSCSLLHVPYSVDYEKNIDSQVKGWLSFAKEKLHEVRNLACLFHMSADSRIIDIITSENKERILEWSQVTYLSDVNDKAPASEYFRKENFKERIKVQKEKIGYPDIPSTTHLVNARKKLLNN